MMKLYITYVITVLFYAECIVGIILNVFIVATNFQNWRKLKTLLTCDKILSYLATSRCLLLFQMMLLFFLIVFFLQLMKNITLSSSILASTMLLNCTNFWFTTILCVFYCVKITNYNHKFFIFLKTRISSLVHWFILVSLAFSVACSLSCGWYFYDLLAFTSGSSKNMTSTTVVFYENTEKMFLMFFVGSLPPFLIFCGAISLLIQSLWMHIRRMRGSGTGFGSPNLEIHFSAVKSMTLFLFLHIVYFTCMNLIVSPVYSINRDWKALIFIIMCSPPFLHSLYIICSTKKLKETFLRCFCCH